MMIGAVSGGSVRQTAETTFHALDHVPVRGRRLQTTVSTVTDLTSALADASVAHIVLAAGHYALSAELRVTRSVTLEAAVSGSVVLDAQASESSARRVLNINPAASDVVELIGLNITGGYMRSNGGGILISRGQVSLTGCSVYGNTASRGGGVYIGGGDVTFNNVNIHNNEATYGDNIFVASGATVCSSAAFTGLEGGPVLVCGAPDPCFPSSAMVAMADGSHSQIDKLKEGDAILAATKEGALTIDTVSLLSIAKHEAKATFINITIADGASLLLTAEHHLPVSAVCCTDLKQAKDIGVDETVWTVQMHTLVGKKVVKITKTIKQGLHSPVPTKGSLPIVNGVVTSFDSISKVTLAEYGLAPLLNVCKATHTCGALRYFFGAHREYVA